MTFLLTSSCVQDVSLQDSEKTCRQALSLVGSSEAQGLSKPSLEYFVKQPRGETDVSLLSQGRKGSGERELR